jgi:phosphatidylserine synthase
MRLSRFNIVGTVEEKNVQYHVGLQVIWSQLVVVFAFPAWSWIGSPARYLLMLVLLMMSFFMVRNILVPKPTQYTLLTVIILSVAGLYTYLHFSGIRTP